MQECTVHTPNTNKHLTTYLDGHCGTKDSLFILLDHSGEKLVHGMITCRGESRFFCVGPSAAVILFNGLRTSFSRPNVAKSNPKSSPCPQLGRHFQQSFNYLKLELFVKKIPKIFRKHFCRRRTKWFLTCTQGKLFKYQRL